MDRNGLRIPVLLAWTLRHEYVFARKRRFADPLHGDTTSLYVELEVYSLAPSYANTHIKRSREEGLELIMS